MLSRLPSGYSNVSNDLDIFLHLNHLKIVETAPSTWQVTNRWDDLLLYAEKSEPASCMATDRDLEVAYIKILDIDGRNIIRYNLPRKKLFSLEQRMDIFSPPAVNIGYLIKKTSSVLYPEFAVKDAEGKTHFLILGQSVFKRGLNDNFRIISKEDGVVIGGISKASCSSFEVMFPLNLSEEMKVTLLGGGFLVYCLYFSKRRS